jgi:D-alanyl-D-alanine carboxypeptidase
MIKTRYGNSHGLININNRSTAYDIALLSTYAMKNPVFREIVSCQVFTCAIKCYDSAQKRDDLNEEH